MPTMAVNSAPQYRPNRITLLPPLDAQHVDEDVDADVDARAHAVGRAELAHPHEHVDAQLLGPGEIPGPCVGIERRDAGGVSLQDGEER